MPWYMTPEVRGRWGGHWAGHEQQHDPARKRADGLPDIWSNYHPLIGLYDSTDPDVLECQLLQMKIAGIDGVIVDWYGIGESADYPPIHEATRAMLDATIRYGLSFAVCYEDRTIATMVERGEMKPDEVPRHLGETLAWLSREWFSKANYVRVDGRPLLLNFGPIYVKEAAVWAEAFSGLPKRPAFFALHHMWKNVGADGGFTWVHAAAWQGEHDPESVQKKLHEVFTRTSTDPRKVIVSAIPGFDDVYREHYPKIDHRGGETLRESLNAALAGAWPIVQLVTWNDYGEGTMIEPTHEFDYRFLEIIQARTREQGAITSEPEGLRLPARLLELRKRKAASKQTLDEVARALAGGDVARARVMMDEVEGR